ISPTLEDLQKPCHSRTMASTGSPLQGRCSLDVPECSHNVCHLIHSASPPGRSHERFQTAAVGRDSELQ
ncbi:Hypothetical predicted protein, partial [Marmota monax]